MINRLHSHDKFGHQIKNDDVIFDGTDYWRACWNTPNGDYLLSCTKGYLHDPTNEQLAQMKVVGIFSDLYLLLACD